MREAEVKKIKVELGLNDKMKNIGTCLSYLVLVFGYLTTASCQAKVESTAVIIPEQDKLFKQWVKDTTTKIKKNPDLMLNGLVKSQIVVDADSLLLSDFKTFEFDSKNKIECKEISNVISLLKEYDELPKDNYHLSFVVEKSFSSSMANGLRYDFDSELKNVIVKTFRTNTEYKYIRGRLSGKKVFKSDIKDENYDLYDFVWEGDKLIKRKLP